MTTIRRKVKLDSLEPGDKIMADEGFECLPEGEHKVLQAPYGLAVECSAGFHHLDGQEAEDGFLIGFYQETRLPDEILCEEWISAVESSIPEQRDSESALAAIHYLLKERRYIRETLSRLLPAEVRAICLDPECKATIGDIIGRRHDE